MQTNLFSWFVAGSQLFFSCTGDLTYRNGGYGQEPETTKVTASLMLDEVKQALAFKPSGDVVPAIFAKTPDDVAHKRTCTEINQRLDDTWYKRATGTGPIHNCGDVWSDDTSLYFNLEYKSAPLSKVKIVETWKGRLDRVTGRLEVDSWMSNDDENGKNISWGKADWALTCKKVDKLVDK